MLLIYLRLISTFCLNCELELRRYGTSQKFPRNGNLILNLIQTSSEKQLPVAAFYSQSVVFITVFSNGMLKFTCKQYEFLNHF